MGGFDGTIPGQPGSGSGPSTSVSDASGWSGGDSTTSADNDLSRETQVHPRLQAMIMAGRYHGMELDPAECPMSGTEGVPSAASLSAWALMEIEANISGDDDGHVHVGDKVMFNFDAIRI